MNLNGKRALIAGSTRGLGYAAARLLAREGAHIAINGRTQEKVQKAVETLTAETAGKVYGFAGDLTDPSFPAQLVSDAANALGGVDILITNASGPPTGSFESLDEAAWQRAIDLCLMSHVRLIRAALPHLRQSPSASVLTITSYSVKQPIPNLILSNSIRSATAALTKSLALELGGDGIRFNSILPGWTETERVEELLLDRAKRKGTSVEEEMRLQAAESSLGRMGTPEEFANAAVFLVSPAASYVTGVLLTVDGGTYKGVY